MRVYKEKPLFLNNGPQAGNPLVLPRPPLPPPSQPKRPRLSSAATPINFSPGGLHVVILDLAVVVVVAAVAVAVAAYILLYSSRAEGPGTQSLKFNNKYGRSAGNRVNFPYRHPSRHHRTHHHSSIRLHVSYIVGPLTF